MPSYEGQPFAAIDARGAQYLLTPIYRARADAQGQVIENCLPRDCVGLRTADGRSVARTAKGRYLVADPDPGSQIKLFSAGPKAI